MPVVSRSEAGNFKSYGDLDMKVLRRDANAAVEFFYGPRKSDREKCVFSVIDDGRLVSPGTERFKTVIRRWLQPVTDKEGNTAVYLFYEDTGTIYDKPTQGPLCKIEEVRIRDGFLNIFGTRRGELVTFRYRIRENSGSFGYPQPVPEGQPRIDEYGTPKERPKAKPVEKPKQTSKPAVTLTPETMINDYLVGKGLKPVPIDMDFHKLYVDVVLYNHTFEDTVGECTGRKSALIQGIIDAMDIPPYVVKRAIQEGVDKKRAQNKQDTEKPKAKPAPKPTAKPKTAPTPKPKKKKTPTEAPKTARNGLSYEVRVGGAIKGVFTSKTKAEAHKKDLKAKGIPAKIVIVGY